MHQPIPARDGSSAQPDFVDQVPRSSKVVLPKARLGRIRARADGGRLQIPQPFQLLFQILFLVFGDSEAITATAIAKYVVPQATQTRRNARSARQLGREEVIIETIVGGWGSPGKIAL